MDQEKDIDPLKVAEAVTDRSEINWGREVSTDGLIKRIVGNLHVLDNIATAHQARPDQVQLEQAPTETLEATADPKDPGTVRLRTWGKLQILESIGEGSYGEVFLAYDPDLQKNVALKLLRIHPDRSDSMSEDVLREARKLARVHHPNVLTVHGAERHDGGVGIWTELIEGDTLEDLLGQRGSFGAEEATHIGIELCKALAGVHGAGLLHGDIKTNNVMREKGGRIVLMDFSSAVDRPTPGEHSPEYMSGTPSFMAPEVLKGEGVSPSSDIYSLGVVLYRLVSGQFPVQGRTPADIAENHLQGKARSLRDVCPHLPEAFLLAVERALVPNLEDRYQSAGEMAQALTALHGVQILPPTPRPFWRKMAVLVPAGVVALGLILTLILWPRSFEVDASLFKALQQSEERIHAGGSITPGDQLFLEIEGSQDMHVYVFNEDESQRTVLLYPLENLDLQNPLPPNTTHRLPGNVNGVPNYWDVTTAGGSETILVVASRDPLENIQEILGDLTQAGDPSRQLSAELNQLRGITGLSAMEEAPQKDDRGQISRISRGLSVRAGNNSGVWIWEMQLRNPAP